MGVAAGRSRRKAAASLRVNCAVPNTAHTLMQTVAFTALLNPCALCHVVTC